MDRRAIVTGSTRSAFGARYIACAALLLASACDARPSAAQAPAPEAAPQPTAVRVERVRPEHESLPTLKFLKTNRDFFRSRLDQLHQIPLADTGEPGALDPRFLAYRTMMNDALAASDSLAAASSERERREVLENVAAFTNLEAELDQMDRLLADQRTRLTALQADFAGRQRTMLAVVVSGYPQGADLDSLTLRFDDGSSRAVVVAAEEREALAHGGVLELFHGLIEPRQQVLEVTLAGARLASGEPGFVALDPTLDRLTYLRFDLSGLRAATGAPAIAASSWLNDDVVSVNDGHPSQP